MSVSQQQVYAIGPAPSSPNSPIFKAWLSEARTLMERVVENPGTPSVDELARQAVARGYRREYVDILTDRLPPYLAYACLVHDLGIARYGTTPRNVSGDLWVYVRAILGRSNPELHRDQRAEPDRR